MSEKKASLANSLSRAAKSARFASGLLQTTPAKISDEHDARILVATWNVGNQKPNPEELQHWLPEGGGEFDVIVIGTQENAFKEKKTSKSEDPRVATAAAGEDEDEEDAAATAQALTNSKSSRTIKRGKSGRSLTMTKAAEQHGGWSVAGKRKSGKAPHAWDLMCAQRLGEAWTVCAHVVLREMRMTVYCTRELAATRVFHIATAYSATGIAGVIGNKGGLVARLTIGHTSIAFCSCHLAAHEGQSHLQSRNAMCREVLDETSGGKIGGTRSAGRPLDAAHSCDHIVWMGDLNYRVDLGLAEDLDELQELLHSPPPDDFLAYVRERSGDNNKHAENSFKRASVGKDNSTHAVHVRAVTALSEAGEYSALMMCDQLYAARRLGDAFVSFQEGPMCFAPTFKVERQPGTLHKAQRTPSYCDRILWKSAAPCRD